MTTDRSQTPPGSNRQKIIAVVFIIILLIILWQIYGLFRADDVAVTPSPPRPTATAGGQQAAQMMPAPQLVPQPANLPARAPTQDPAAARQQQQSEAQYVAGLNQLQLLRLQRDIEETNRAIMAAKLEIITAQKNIVDLLQPPQPVVQPNPYASTTLLGTARPQATTQPTPPPPRAAEPSIQVTTTQVANYSVISVSQVQNRWGAVLGFQGRLYNVSTGDVLPPDGSKVVEIDRGGVILDKDGVKRRVSLVPII